LAPHRRPPAPRGAPPARPWPATPRGAPAPPHRGREGTPRGHPIPELGAGVGQLPRTRRHRLAIYPSRALVGFPALIGLPDLAFGNTERFRLLPQVPPLAG